MSVAAPIRRNDPCPCGSGRRYKECHGKLAAGAPPASDALARALELHRRGRVAEAEPIYRGVLAKDPGNAIATHYLGMAAWQSGDVAEAERLMRASIEANPAIADFHNNLALLLRDTRRPAEAIEGYARALAADPAWFEAYNNLGLALEDLGRFQEALAAYGEAIAREPRFAAARQNRARLLLAGGRFAEGWEEYRWRLVAQGLDANAPDPHAARPPAALTGRRFELVGEQGLGDILFFLRFAPELVRRGATLAFRGDARLHGMLARTGLFAAGMRAGTDPPGSEDRFFVGDLPWLLGAADAASLPPPLALSALPERIEAARARLEAAGPRPRIALTWRAGTVSTGPSRVQLKEVPQEILVHALRGTPASWISVQRLPRPGETAELANALAAPVHDFSHANEDLEEMLAVLSLADGYLGVSSANAHLRAGVGGAMDVLVPFPPEWRWAFGGGRSPWFPAMRVIRQSRDGGWDPEAVPRYGR